MTVTDRMVLLLAIAGGGVDAVMLAAFGVLTAAQTGNTILLAVALGQGRLGAGLAAGISVVGYVVGAGLGELTIEGGRTRQSGRPLIARALVAELLLLTGVLVAWRLMGSSPSPGEQSALVALAASAMGIQSAVVLRLHAGTATTYVTGTLTTFTTGMIRWLHVGGPEPSRPAIEQTSALPRSGRQERPWMYGVSWSVYAAGAVVTAFLWVRTREAALLLPIVALAVVVLAAYLPSEKYRSLASPVPSQPEGP